MQGVISLLPLSMFFFLSLVYRILTKMCLGMISLDFFTTSMIVLYFESSELCININSPGKGPH